MKRAGRPRRSEERPDSPFGEILKEHLRRVRDYTQAQLAQESLIPERTLSRMVKGRRVSGSTLRRDLRSIVRSLFQARALLTLEEANQLITSIPATSALDERDPEDAAIIRLFASQPVESDQSAAHYHASAAASAHTFPDDANKVPVSEIPLHQPLLPGEEMTGRLVRETRRHARQRMVALFLALVVLAGAGLSIAGVILARQMSTCSANAQGVTLYADLQYQGHCATLGPGDYELARYGLEENVSSIRNPNGAYHITLFDKAKNFYALDSDMPVLPAEWDNRADTVHIEKHRPTSCHPGSDGIIAFLNTDYAGGCLFITGDIPDLTPLNFERVIVSLQFVGSYQEKKELVIYQQPAYHQECGVYWQDQSDLLQCARLAVSVRVLPFTPPTPVPTVPGTRDAGNVAPLASLSPGNAQAVVDGNLQTEWIGGHQVGLNLGWVFPVTIHRVVVWDRRQSSSDNNQINKLKLVFSDGTATGSLEMRSQGPRCVDVSFPAQSVTWLHILPVDASGNNGLREVEVWATTGPQYSRNTCVNRLILSQLVVGKTQT